MLSKYIRKTLSGKYRLILNIGTYDTLEKAEEIRDKILSIPEVSALRREIDWRANFTPEEDELLHELNEKGVPVKEQQRKYLKHRTAKSIHSRRQYIGLKFKDDVFMLKQLKRGQKS